MKLKFKNTNINYAVTKTKNKEGLASNDSWLMVDFYVENDEFSYHSCRESLSLGEIVEACDIIRKLYDEPIKVSEKITFIKNYFKIYIKNTPEKKTMVLNLIDLNDSKRTSYKLYFEQEEILEFVALSQNIA